MQLFVWQNQKKYIYSDFVEQMKPGMHRKYIGELEELVLFMVGILQDEAYGVRVMQELETQANRSVNISTVHATLHRLEEKGYVKSHLAGATATRGGRRKRYFQLTRSGQHVLQEFYELRSRLWQQLPKISLS